jgi:hypothetical protein
MGKARNGDGNGACTCTKEGDVGWAQKCTCTPCPAFDTPSHEYNWTDLQPGTRIQNKISTAMHTHVPAWYQGIILSAKRQ